MYSLLSVSHSFSPPGMDQKQPEPFKPSTRPLHYRDKRCVGTHTGVGAGEVVEEIGYFGGGGLESGRDRRVGEVDEVGTTSFESTRKSNVVRSVSGTKPSASAI